MHSLSHRLPGSPTPSCAISHRQESGYKAQQYSMYIPLPQPDTRCQQYCIQQNRFADVMKACRYSRDTDWRDPSNWSCNDNVHPSRHGTYDGISMHPYETIFVKASWQVGEPHLSRYTEWMQAHAAGKHGTEGTFNKSIYEYAISSRGNNPGNLSTIFMPQM